MGARDNNEKPAFEGLHSALRTVRSEGAAQLVRTSQAAQQTTVDHKQQSSKHDLFALWG